jgi:hypothetical protein
VLGIYHFASKNISGEGFLVQYIGLRALVSSGTSPYDNSITDQIQEFINYQSSFTETNHPRYTSPLFSGIIVFPFAFIENKVLSHTLWLCAQIIAIFLILLAGIKLTGWKASWYIYFLFSLLTTFSYHVFVPWLDGGLSIWAAFFLIGALLAIRNHWNEFAGILLAMAFIQPQMTILIIVFTLIWGASSGNKRIVLWFFVTILVLSASSLLFDPGWIEQYIKIIYNFGEFFPAGNPGIYFKELWPGLGKQLGWLMTGVLCLILLIEWYFSLKKDYRWFLWVACLTMAISQWIGIHTIPGHLTGLIFPVILVSAMLTERWHMGGQWIAILIMLIIFFWEWALFLDNLNNSQLFTQLNLLLPLPLILIIGLYWVRWWAVKPKRLLLEELRSGEGI